MPFASATTIRVKALSEAPPEQKFKIQLEVKEMGANSTQAQAVAALIVGFVFIAAGLATDINYLWVVVGLVLLGGSVGLFLKCKPWEHRES
jgi:hypothetical protein